MAEYTHYCNNCHSYLDKTDIWETYEEDTNYYSSGCRWCGSDDIEECHPCPICGQATVEEFCSDCYEKIQTGLNNLQEEMGAELGDFQNIISNNFGW